MTKSNLNDKNKLTDKLLYNKSSNWTRMDEALKRSGWKDWVDILLSDCPADYSVGPHYSIWSIKYDKLEWGYKIKKGCRKITCEECWGTEYTKGGLR
jgi:hypothetical protein